MVVGIPNGFLQTAQVAEHCSLAVLAEVSNLWEPELFVDFSGFVLGPHQSVESREHDRSTDAGFRRQRRIGGFWPLVQKTKAHRSLSEAQVSDDVFAFVGNVAADSMVKNEDRASLRLIFLTLVDRIAALKVLLPGAPRVYELLPKFTFVAVGGMLQVGAFGLGPGPFTVSGTSGLGRPVSLLMSAGRKGQHPQKGLRFQEVCPLVRIPRHTNTVTPIKWMGLGRTHRLRVPKVFLWFS